jgi:hypothetical protein
MKELKGLKKNKIRGGRLKCYLGLEQKKKKKKKKKLERKSDEACLKF